MKICIVLSTRPEIIKLAPIINLLKQKKIKFFLINTNQHYINIMSSVFFKFLKYQNQNIISKLQTKLMVLFFQKQLRILRIF